MNFYNNHELPDQFAHIEIDDKELYYPRITVRKEIRKQAEIHLRKKYPIGKYTDSNDIIKILNYQFKFYDSKIQKIIPQLFCKDWLAFTIFQYEIFGEIAKKYKNQTLTQHDLLYWRKNGPTFRQAADLLCDKFIEFSVEGNECDLDLIKTSIYYDTIWICAENCVNYASSSNLTFMLLNEESFIEILPPDNDYFLTQGSLKQSSFDDCYGYYEKQTNRDIKLRQKYLKGKEFDHDIKKHISVLDSPLKEFLGMSYSEILYLLTSISLSTRPITSPDKVPMVDKEKYFIELSSKGKFPIESIKRTFDALTLSKEKLKRNPREVWNYKQQNRVSKKPFLEISYKGKDHLLWSDNKLQDFLTLLDLDVTFKNFPSELMNSQVSKAIDTISNQAGKWFESQVVHHMNKLNIKGSNFKKKVISNKSGTEVLCLAGEIDFLGLSISDSAIVLIECKMINSGFEARSFRQDRDKFLKGKHSYVKKLIRKTNWIFDNFNIIRKVLCENYNYQESEISRKVLVGFITYYTSMVPCFLSFFPCVSLVDFIEKYKSESIWPYHNGINYKKINIE